MSQIDTYTTGFKRTKCLALEQFIKTCKKETCKEDIIILLSADPGEICMINNLT